MVGVYSSITNLSRETFLSIHSTSTRPSECSESFKSMSGVVRRDGDSDDDNDDDRDNNDR